MKTTTLTDWIAVATAGLPASAVEKFSAEIADHAAEARAKHIDAGLSAEDADRAAVADLGDAKQVARTLRDAHFSRGEYSRACNTIVTMLVIFGIQAILDQIAMRLDSASNPGALIGWWRMYGHSAVSALMCLPTLIVAYSVVLFLKEQYDILIPRWVRAVFFISIVLISSFGGLQVLFLRSSAAINMARLVVSITYSLTLCAVSIRWLLTTPIRSHPVRSVLLILGLTVGAEIAFGNVLSLLSSRLTPPDILIQFSSALTNTFYIPWYALNLLVLGILITLRRSGRAIAA